MKFHDTHRVLGDDEEGMCRNCHAMISEGKIQDPTWRDLVEEPCLANWRVAQAMWKELKELRLIIIGEYGGDMSQFEDFKGL